jgi:predicted RNA-binding Zn-ribbon protein involved in translation (DUF1610 family)
VPGQKINHEFTREVVCPHCGYEFSDSWELGPGKGDSEDIEVECGDCGETFICWRNITVNWSSAKIEVKPVLDENDLLKRKLKTAQAALQYYAPIITGPIEQLGDIGKTARDAILKIKKMK